MSRKLPLAEDGRELTAFGTPAFPLSMVDNNFGEFVTGQVPWHWHNTFEFSYVLEGCVLMEFERGSEIIRAGEGIFFNYGSLHNANQIDGKPCSWISIHFDAPVIGGAPHSVFESEYVKPFMESGINALMFRHENTWEERVLFLIVAAYEEYCRNDYGCEIILRNYFSEIWLLMVRQYSNALENANEKPGDGRIKTMLNYIHDHYMNEISLDHIAACANVSTRECNRCFQKHLGMTTFAYLLGYRVRIAAEMLTKTDLPVTDICFRTGFNGTSYFGKSFKAVTGMTPRDFRKKHRVTAL